MYSRGGGYEFLRPRHPHRGNRQTRGTPTAETGSDILDILHGLADRVGPKNVHVSEGICSNLGEMQEVTNVFVASSVT